MFTKTVTLPANQATGCDLRKIAKFIDHCFALGVIPSDTELNGLGIKHSEAFNRDRRPHVYYHSAIYNLVGDDWSSLHLKQHEDAAGKWLVYTLYTSGIEVVCAPSRYPMIEMKIRSEMFHPIEKDQVLKNVSTVVNAITALTDMWKSERGDVQVINSK